MCAFFKACAIFHAGSKCFTFCILATEEFTYCGEKVSELSTKKVEGKTRIGGKVVYVKVFNDQIIWDVEERSVDKLEVLAEYSTVINPDLLEQEEMESICSDSL